MRFEITTYSQASAYHSPWSLRRRFALLAWNLAWPCFCGWTPKPLNLWRLLILRIFGAKIEGRPFVHGRARIQQPWNLVLRHRACLGDRAHVYNLGLVEVGEDATVAQEAYLCTGTHDFDDPRRLLQTSPIIVGRGAFIGARAFVLPGLSIGEEAIVGACAVVTRSVEPRTVVAGNPARLVAKRRADGTGGRTPAPG